MIGFLNPGLLYLLPLALLPVIVHLLNRLRYRRVPWAAMEFLMASQRRTVRRSRLRNLLLLAARVLVLVFFIMAISRPVATSGIFASVFAGTGGARFVLIDNSLSMSYTRHGKTALAAALECAKSALGSGAGGGPTDFAAMIQPAGGVSFLTSERAREGLEKFLGGTDAGGNVQKALAAAAREISSRGLVGSEIVIVGDLQRYDWHVPDDAGWNRLRGELAGLSGVSVRVVDVSSGGWQNSAITGLEMSETILVPGRKIRLTAFLSRSANAPASATVSLILGEAKSASKVVKWQDGSLEARCTFDLTVASDTVTGRVELSGDSLAADNRQYFVLEPFGKIPVLCLDGRPSDGGLSGASGFIAAALDPGSQNGELNPITVKVVSAVGSPDVVLNDYSAVVMASVASPSREFMEELRTYVERGGILIVFPGERADPASYAVGAGIMPAALEKVVQSKTREGVSIASVDYSAPALEKFDRTDNPRLADVRAWQWWKLSPKADAPVKVLLGLATGAPWLIERRVGSGEVIMFATPCDGTWGSMPVSACFLPLMHRLILNFVASSTRTNVLTTGEPLGPPGGTGDRFEVSFPVGPQGGTGDRLEVSFPGAEKAQYGSAGDSAGCYDTLNAGIYRVRGIPVGTWESYAVNGPAGESYGKKITEEEIRGLLGEIPLTVLRSDPGSPAAAGSREGWPLAAALVLLFLLAEVLIARTIDRG